MLDGGSGPDASRRPLASGASDGPRCEGGTMDYQSVSSQVAARSGFGNMEPLNLHI